jgi:hypothetical protein
MNLFPIQFSKLNITGPLHPSMPYIVLKELAFELGLIVSVERLKTDIRYWAKIFKKLAEFEPLKIENLNHPDPVDKHKLMQIINPTESNWETENLRKCFSFLIFVSEWIQNKLPIEDEEYILSKECGLQSNQNIYSLNACVLYAICQLKQINVGLESTTEEMKTMIDIFYSPSKTIIGDEFSRSGSFRFSLEEELSPIQKFHEDAEEAEINITVTPVSEESESAVAEGPYQIYDEIENLQSISLLMTDMNYCLKYMEPVNSNQAIVLGSLLFQKDFSKYNHPLREFRRFKSDIPTFASEELIMTEAKKRNPYYDDLNLYFNPYLSKNAYSSEFLEHHIGLFSYSTSEYFGSIHFNILQELHLQENFHLGYHPNIINSETPVYIEQISNLKNEMIVCFGVKEEVLHATTWEELRDIFTNCHMFMNPFEKQRLFTKDQIERLNRLGKWIVQSYKSRNNYFYLFSDYAEETIESIESCLDVIDKITLISQSEFYFMNQLVSDYLQRSKQEKQLIEEGIEKLFELTMYMRGWNGETKNYPIASAPNPLNYDQTERNILECIFELDHINSNANDFIYQLPLITWKNEYVQSTTEEQGLTIGERIKIVKNGENQGIQSCVRMSSNVLGASYSFYCKIFKIPEKLNIRNLIYIQ